MSGAAARTGLGAGLRLWLHRELPVAAAWLSLVMEALSIGLAGLLQHKLRSLLTMLGIIFGVAAVIAMMAIGAGAREETLRQIQAYGADILYVKAVKLSSDKLQEAKRAFSVGLSSEDGKLIQEICPFVKRVAPQAVQDFKVSRQEREPKANVVGIDGAFFELTRQQLAEGRPISEDDVRLGRRVCVLAWGLRKALFVNTRPIGEVVKVSGVNFTVVGVVSERGRAAGENGQRGGGAQIKTRDVTQDLYIPISVALESFTRRRDTSDSEKDPSYGLVREMIVQVDRMENLLEAKKVVSRILRRRHSGIEDFEVIVPLEILQQSKAAQDTFNLVMALIAGLSLLVGGIGIMNIMLANVTERTREIGIRRALGASRHDILLQFLLEAVVLCVAGGLAGIVLGQGIAWAVRWFLHWEVITTLASVVLAFTVSSAVGIVFGFFPAWSAARMDPIQALRYE